MHHEFSGLRLLKSSIFIVLLLCTSGTFAQDPIRYIIDVQVVDRETGRIIPTASMQVSGSNLARITDTLGWFRLYVPAGQYTMQYSHIAYEGFEHQVKISRDTVFQVKLTRKIIRIDEVEIVGGRILNITPDLNMHVSDYLLANQYVIYIGHPSKKPEYRLYLTYESGKQLDNRLIRKHGILQKDYLDRTWYIGTDSAWRIGVDAGRLVIDKPWSLKAYNDSISPIILKWNDRQIYQDYYPEQQGLMTFCNIPPSLEFFTISAVRDSLAMHLAATKMIDDYATWIADMFEAQVESEKRAGREQMIGGGSGPMAGVVIRPGNTNYNKPKNYSPIPILRNLIAPVFLFKGLLYQLDFYAGYITSYNDRLRRVSKTPVDFHIYQRPMGKLRRMYYPLIDYSHNQVYVWTQLIDRLEIYRLNLETGQLLERLDLDKYQNVHNLQIANGSLYFLYNELTYPFATRLFRMDLKAF